MTMLKPQKNQQGLMLVAALVLVIILGVVAVIVARIATTDLAASSEQADAVDAFAIANSGLERAVYELSRVDPSDRTACADLAGTFGTQNFGHGQYNISGTHYHPTGVTLSVNILAASTIAPISTLSGVAPAGQVRIGREYINYGGTGSTSAGCGGGSAPCLTGLVRGVQNTVASAHSNGESVYQDQCVVRSEAGVPNLSSPDAKRTLDAIMIAYESAWVVGDTFNSNATTGYWESQSWNYQAPSPAINNNLNDVFCLNNQDCWAVGDNRTFLHWDGASWSAGNVRTFGLFSAVPYVDFQSVYCVNSNECWAVGDRSWLLSSIAYWNGTIWSRVFPFSLRSEDLISVTCAASNSCWAVGDDRIFYYFNGALWYDGFVDIFGADAVPYENYTGVSCIDSGDCWAVGQDGALAYWNGSIWRGDLSVVPSSDYYAVNCSATDDCWAVGEVSSGDPLIIYWNGSSWQREPEAQMDSVPVVNLYDIDCSASDNCWASGASGALIHWDGTDWSGNVTSNLPTVALRGLSILRADRPRPAGFWQQI